ncbi:MAG: barstar family protein [Chloroflexota bacterium]|nr:barstar family protein [Chloroflexota bacterium]
MATLWDGWNTLLTPRPPWAHLVRAAQRDLEVALRADAPANVGAVVRMLRGGRCATKRGLMQEWGAALQFPYYFGENWDAFEECVNDLGWLPARGYILAVTDAERLLGEGDDFATLVHILDAAATRWEDGAGAGPDRPKLPVSFHVIFQCDREKEGETRHRFADVAVALAELPPLGP